MAGKRGLIFLIICCLLNSCLVLFYKRPKENFDPGKNPTVPDYRNEFYWAALPQKSDMADKTPKGVSLPENQKEAEVDVFFIHPTSYKGKKWNAEIIRKKTRRRTDKRSIKHQASVFNASCRVYAPRYRQATFSAFQDSLNGYKAIDLAYRDVKESFEYYLKNYNQGRPFFIAGHSQGTFHGTRLVKEISQDSLLLKRMVAAYLIGIPVIPDSLKMIDPCGHPSQTNCFISWFTLGINDLPKNAERSFELQTKNFTRIYRNNLCVNPLSWKIDTLLIDADQNTGSSSVTFNKVHRNVANAQCSDGILWVKVHKKRHLFLPFRKENYHPLDYNLFYNSIRENVKVRTDAFLMKK